MKKHIDGYGRECNVCGTYKKWDQYTKAKHTSTGHISTCKPCMSERNKGYRMIKLKSGQTVLEGFSQKMQDFYLGKTSGTT